MSGGTTRGTNLQQLEHYSGWFLRRASACSSPNWQPAPQGRDVSCRSALPHRSAGCCEQRHLRHGTRRAVPEEGGEDAQIALGPAAASTAIAAACAQLEPKPGWPKIARFAQNIASAAPSPHPQNDMVKRVRRELGDLLHRHGFAIEDCLVTVGCPQPGRCAFGARACILLRSEHWLSVAAHGGCSCLHPHGGMPRAGLPRAFFGPCSACVPLVGQGRRPSRLQIACCTQSARLGPVRHASLRVKPFALLSFFLSFFPGPDTGAHSKGGNVQRADIAKEQGVRCRAGRGRQGELLPAFKMMAPRKLAIRGSH